MTILEAIEEYVALKRSLGAIFTTEAKKLRSFARSVGDVLLEEVTPEHCRDFWNDNVPATNSSVKKQQILTRFFRHLVGRRYLSDSPAKGPTRRFVSTFQPYVYSQGELRTLLDTAARLSDLFRFDGLTFRTLLLLLYATGLRVGEALRLRCSDVDLSTRILTVWSSKFFKSRLVPFGGDLARSLNRYHDHRSAFAFPFDQRSTFFATRAGKKIRLNRVEIAFRRAFTEAKIMRSDTETYQPRIHDLRATFAVHRLVAWYREGADVQQQLPFLATYLGHTDLSGTQTYLRMTPELLGEASRLFETYVTSRKEIGNE